ncbi:hypothetical protein LCGC14_1467770 [marine sediment metagenome]|uniref:Uncharacterized protein n=1 Tax=marine sediment metagenome TaxID=412755 RepID=A0A0F9JDD1_9ZZZZ
MATFAQQMVEKYRTLLADSAGLKSVTADGQSVTYGELEERLRCWESRATRFCSAVSSRDAILAGGGSIGGVPAKTL